MQIHEITKINEGFMDAVKGIGSVAAQSLNKNLGTNIGGAAAGARVAPGQIQQTALQINSQLAQKQAEQLAADYAQVAAQPNVNSTILRNELNIIISKRLIPQIRDINQLPGLVDPSQKSLADQIVRRVNSAVITLSNPKVAAKPELSQKVWSQLTNVAAQAQNLMVFNPAKQKPAKPGAPAPAPAQTSGGVPEIDVSKTGDILYRGQPYDPNDPIARNAVTQWLLSHPNLAANRP